MTNHLGDIASNSWRRKGAGRSSNLWFLILVLLLSGALFVSCQPVAGETMPSQPHTETSPAGATPTGSSRLIYEHPSEVDNSKLPTTPTDKINVTGNAPEVDIAWYRLTIDGLVESPLSLTYDELKEYPAVTEVVLLICQYWFADNAEWTGVPVTTLLTEAGIKPGASEIVFHAMDGYITRLPLEVAQRDGVFLAYMVNGETLPAEHGYPLRLVVKGEFGSDWIKWIERIEVK